MGTRNLTAVMLNGEYKIAQYGQWDGYPSGQGLTALEFLRDANIADFKKSVSECRFLSSDELDELGKTDWKKTHAHLSRDRAAEILGLVDGGVRELKNSIGFAGDSLFCEYAYIVDLDKETFEVFEGYNKNKVIEGRFTTGMEFLENTDGYHPVVLIKEYSLNDLPTNDVFLADLEPEDD